MVHRHNHVRLMCLFYSTYLPTQVHAQVHKNVQADSFYRWALSINQTYKMWFLPCLCFPSITGACKFLFDYKIQMGSVQTINCGGNVWSLRKETNLNQITSYSRYGILEPRIQTYFVCIKASFEPKVLSVRLPIYSSGELQGLNN